MPRSIQRADRALGRLVWGASTLLLLAVSGFAAYAGVAGFAQTTGGERWAILAVALAFAALTLAAAWRAARRRDLSEALDDS